MTPVEFFIYAIFAAVLINLGMWMDDRAEKKEQRKELMKWLDYSE